MGCLQKEDALPQIFHRISLQIVIKNSNRNLGYGNLHALGPDKTRDIEGRHVFAKFFNFRIHLRIDGGRMGTHPNHIPDLLHGLPLKS